MNFLKKSDLKDKIYFKFLLYFIYKILLEVIYVWGIGKYFTEFTYSISVFEYLLYSFVYFIMVYVMVHLDKIKKNSALMISLFNWFYFIPGLIFIEFSAKNYIYLLLTLVFFFELNIIYMLFSRKNHEKKAATNIKKESNIYVYYIYILISIVGLYICAKYNDLKFSLSFDNIYEFRAESKSVNMPSIFNYFKTWCALLIPIGIIYFHNKKENYIIGLLTITQLFLFSFGKLKTDLAMLLFAFAIIIVKRKYLKKLFYLILIVTSIFAIVAVLDKKMNTLISYIYRRGMFLPSKISYEYYDFFKSHQPDFLRQSWLRHFGFASPYGVPIGNLIGKIYYGSAGSNLCNGLIGDAMANLGVTGIFVYPILYVVVLKIFDYFTSELDYKTILLVSLRFFISFSNGFFFQVLLTQGFAVCLMLFYFIKLCEKNKVNQYSKNF